MALARCAVTCAVFALAPAGCFDWTVAPADCATLASELAAARAQAQECSADSAGACAAAVDDPCAGAVWLGDPSSAAAAQYQSLLDQQQAARCGCAQAVSGGSSTTSCVASADGKSATCVK